MLRNSVIICMYLFYFLIQNNLGLCSNLKTNIIEISNKIVDNKVQIQLINDYIDNLNDNYKKKQQQLINNNKEFQTSITILYKLTLKPKETLLVENFNKNQILDLFVLINYWINHAYEQIHKNYTILKGIEDNTKKLNIAQVKLISINSTLQNNKMLLNSLLKENRLNEKDIANINQSIQNLRYSSINLQKNQTLFSLINQPLLTEKEKEKDIQFYIKNKFKMLWPNNGYIYSHFKVGNYYSINYYGIVIVGNANSKIVAPASGEIIFINKLDIYNTVIIIKHSPSYVSILSGNFKPKVYLAEKVHNGQVIATIAQETKPIYFELNYKNDPIDPEQWLIKREN